MNFSRFRFLKATVENVSCYFRDNLILAVLVVLVLPAQAADFAWVEGESATVTPADFKPDIAGGPASILSAGKWLAINIDSAQVEAKLPEGGITLHYNFTLASAGSNYIWTHMGFEQARPPLEWRVDNEPWQAASPESPTIDLRELGLWTPVAWMKLGTENLTAGAHTFEIRIAKTKNKDGKYDDFHFGLDTILLTSQPFQPDGTIQPGDNGWMTEPDKNAATKVFEIPGASDPEQHAVALQGDWQYAGADEFVVENRLDPVKALPTVNSLNWHALAVPSDRNAVLPEQKYIHRYFLRTRINVPADLAGHSFVLHFPGVSVIGSVFVNGQYVDGTKNCFAVWDVDVTKVVKLGQVNEIVVAIKDPFYALTGDPNPKKIAYVPYSFWHFNLPSQLLLPILGQGGDSIPTGLLLGAPSLVVGGAAYAADVFAIPSVKNKTLGLEITLHNPTDQPVSGSLSNEIVPLDGGAAEKTFAAKDITIPAGQDSVVQLSESWANPKLWWPGDNPAAQYNVVTRLAVGGKIIDERKTKFGFREWTYDGPEFKINGIPWHGFADTQGGTVDEMRQRGQNMVRVWWQDENSEARQNDLDAKGMPARRTGTFDGEGTGGFYNIGSGVLWDNYRDQMQAWVKGLRNHPSIFLWSMENEITFINGHVTGNDETTTREIKKSADLLKIVDPTRAAASDGGNALLDESLEVYLGHYMDPPINTYPEGAYDKAGLAHRQIWPITKDKPIIWGEAAWGGSEARIQATVGGEAAFIGTAEARPATALSIRMLSEGYRWNGISFNFWTDHQIPSYYIAWQPVAVLCRQWDCTFGSGQSVKRTLGIFNDTHFDDPITLTWTLTVDGKKITEETSVHRIAAGSNDKFDVSVPMPQVEHREEGTWKLLLSRGGKTAFEDSKDVSVLPPASSLLIGAQLPPGLIGLFDPKGDGAIEKFLRDAGVKTTAIKSLDNIPGGIKTLIVGSDALEEINSTSSQLSAWASTGKGLILLEQKFLLKFQGLPGEMSTDDNHGCIGFAEDADGPIFAGLKQKDLFCWGSDNWLYRDAYVKPVSGGRSIIQCDLSLADSALVEMHPGSGLMLLSQLLIGEKLQNSAVAQALLLNMVKYAASYRLEFKPVTSCVSPNGPLAKALDTIGLQYDKATDPVAAVSEAGAVSVIEATPDNLKALSSNLAKVKSFTQSGGWILLNNLTPDGLADFNKLVGVEHVIRPFKKEKVTWATPRDSLTAGLPTSDIVYGTGKQIVWFAPQEWPDQNGYSYVVDIDDVAPFASSTYSAWDNAVNNYTQADGAWQLIQNLPPGDAVIPMKLARPEKLTQFTWGSDTNYQGTTKIQLTINGKDYIFNTQPNGEPQTFDLTDQPTASELTLKVLDWTHDPKKNNDGKELVGIDNLYLKVARPPEFYQKVHPLLNIGAMVKYPQGKGGIILCNVKFLDNEENPVNVTKKRGILTGLLQNLKAPFAGGGKTIIAGANLQFTPISIAKQANQFRGDQGWFGDKTHSFEGLPPGKQTMAGVVYDIYRFTSSIVPEAVMLGGDGIPGNLPAGVKGIPVNQKADALFFLQTARIDARRNSDEIKQDKKYEIATYVIHYADGKDERVPIYAEINVDDAKQATPKAIPGAQIAWTNTYPDNTSAVAYSMQWNNPRSDVEISSVDLVYGPDKRGVPALLAITAAKAP